MSVASNVAGAAVTLHRVIRFSKTRRSIMRLITADLRATMLENGRCGAAANDGTHDFYPVVKLFTPWGGATWLLTELHPGDSDMAFGLCDLGDGMPRLARVRVSAIASIRGPAGLRVERDPLFRADRPLSAYAEDAQRRGYVFS